MTRHSAGIVVFRVGATNVDVLLGHMGGPFWQRKDDSAWSIPKGEFTDDEDPLDAARREFQEELGCAVPGGELFDLGEVAQSGRKSVRAWAVEGDLDVAAVTSNTFDLEWPPKSGRIQQFPEIDRAAWFDLPTAHTKIVRGQRELLDRLVALLSER
ncbi:MAG: NUDIX domain-containing protein [Ilumatobacteraceae bacterium]